MTLSPYAFTKILRPAIEALRSKGIKVAYMDNILLMAKSPLSYLIQLLQSLGWYISSEKSHLVPDQLRDHLGFTLDTRGSQVLIRVQEAKRKTVPKEVKHLITRAQKGPVHPRLVARVTGLCLSLSRVVSPTKVLLQNIYADLAHLVSWSQQIMLQQATLKDLHWWLDCLRTWDSKTITDPPTEMILEVDASNTGWGAALGHKIAAGTWGSNSELTHINVKEALAVFYVLLTFLPFIQEKSILVWSDNMVTVAYINKMTGRKRVLATVARAIHNLCWKHNITIQAVHIPGLQNNIADTLSRWSDNYNWGLSPKIFSVLDKEWGPHTIDRFAGFENHLLPRFNARYLCPGAEAMDALTVPWLGENNFINPPFRLLPRILEKLKRERATATVIAPLWPAQSWFWQLLEMSTAPPALISNNKAAYTLGISGKIEPLRNPRWRLAAFRVHGALMQRAGARKLAASLKKEAGPRPHLVSTKRTSGTSFYGANRRNALSRLEAQRRMLPRWQTTWRTRPRACRDQAPPSRSFARLQTTWRPCSIYDCQWTTQPLQSCAIQLWSGAQPDL